MRYGLSMYLFLILVCIVGCNTTSKPKSLDGHASKVYNWCTYLTQQEARNTLASYKEYPFIEAALRDRFEGDLINLHRWDQGGLDGITFILEWNRKEFFGTSYYETGVNEDDPLWIHAYVRKPFPALHLAEIIDCLGAPDSFAITDYLFAFEDYEDAETVYLYYVEQDIELQVIKPHSQNLSASSLDLRFSQIYTFPPGHLDTKLAALSNSDSPAKKDIQLWEQ